MDGTFASWYEPGSPITGSVWDALAAPVLALRPAQRLRVLLLGLGGGSAARIVRALMPDAVIVGVERELDVVKAARSDFDLDELDVEVVIEDARSFLAHERRRFDIVLEDVFVGAGDAVYKPDWLPLPGHELAARRLDRGGILVSNTLDETAHFARTLHTMFASVVSIGVEDFDNRILAAGPAALTARSLRAAVARDPILSPTLSKLSFKTLRARC